MGLVVSWQQLEKIFKYFLFIDSTLWNAHFRVSVSAILFFIINWLLLEFNYPSWGTKYETALVQTSAVFFMGLAFLFFEMPHRFLNVGNGLKK